MANPALENRCDDGRLDRYLAGQCERRECELLEQHLNDCPRCRGVIESRAAEDSFWISVPQNLDTRLDIGSPTKSFHPSTSSAISHAIDDATTRRYLEQWLDPPGDVEHSIGRLAQFEITGILGIGGMGLVLSAYDTLARRAIAIKTLRQYLTASPDAIERFLREAKNAASIEHACVISIYAVDTWRGLPYLVMPLIDQGSLRERVGVPFTLAEILSVGYQVSLGLEAAHQRGMVHRDLKPSNILLLRGTDQVVLADFGLARTIDDETLTASGTITGTPAFMSPEQARGDAIDTRSDLFSLGSLMYWMATSKSPFAAESSFATLSKIVHDGYPPLGTVRPEMPAWLDLLIARLLDKNPRTRLAPAGNVADLIRQSMNHIADPAIHPLPTALVPSKVSSRAKMILATSLLSIAGIVVLFTVVLKTLGEKPDPFDPNAVQTTDRQVAVTEMPTATQVDLDSTDPIKELDEVDALDDLDRVNVVADLQDRHRVLYWLGRLQLLPISEIPKKLFPILDELAVDTDREIAASATAILNKNPFEEAH